MASNRDVAALDSEIARVQRLSSTGRDSEAEDLCTHLIGEFPGRFEPYFHRALAKHSLGDRSGAIADLTEAIRLNASEPASLFFRGRWQIEAGEYAIGISDLHQAIIADEALCSEYYTEPARLSVAVAYLLQGDFAQAELASRGLSPSAATYLAGRRWTIGDLRRR
jgi:tetratricopeptide (TPR) repeat protein